MVAFIVIASTKPNGRYWLGARSDPSPIKGVTWKCDATFDGRQREIGLVVGDSNIDYLRPDVDQKYFVGRYTLDGSVFRATFNSSYWPLHNYSEKLARSIFWFGTFKQSTGGILEIDTGETLSGDLNTVHVVATCHK
jgi:hypothetical protein